MAPLQGAQRMHAQSLNCAAMKVIDLGRCDYEATYHAMQAWAQARTPETPDELWLCEHAPVFTQGIAGRAEHILNARGVPVIQSNRGGQVTFHGPGQVVAYPLVDLRRLSVHVRGYVHRLEAAVIEVLAHHGVQGQRVTGAPGIFVQLERAVPGSSALRAGVESRWAGLGKIAALGIKVSRHCAYHGVALNVAMDLSPFDDINPCGYVGLKTVDLATLGVHTSWRDAADRLADRLSAHLLPPVA